VVSGTELWTATIGELDTTEYASGLDLDGGGDVLLAYHSGELGHLARHQGSDGMVVWDEEDASDAQTGISALAVDGNGRPIVGVWKADIDGLTTTTWLRAHDPDGSVPWEQPSDGNVTGLAIRDGDEIAAVANVDNGGGDYDPLVEIYDADGASVWRVDDPADHVLFAVDVADDGQLVVAGRNGGDGWIGRYDADGVEVWTLPNAGAREWVGIAFHPGGGLVTVGDAPLPFGSVTRWTDVPAIAWEQEIHGEDAGQTGRMKDVAVDAAGNVVACGTKGVPDAQIGYVTLLRKYTPAGDPLWTYVDDTDDGMCRYVALDADGAVYMLADRDGNGNSPAADVVLRKLAP
jgi:hypothetical protein